MLSLVGCASSDVVLEVKGYPVYKFVDIGGIDTKALKANEKRLRELLGADYDVYAAQQQLFASRGFDLHHPLIIQPESGTEMLVYVQTKDYEELWKVNPHDLAKQKRSHYVSLKYIQVQVGDETVNRAVSFDSKLMERDPIIRK
jgi:hypothetical protein